MKAFQELKKNTKKDMSSLPEIKVALLGDVATQFLALAIKGIGYDCGYRINLFEAPFNEVERQILDPDSELYQFNAKYTIILQSTHKLNEKYCLVSADHQSTIADERLNFVKKTCHAINGTMIYFNYGEIEDTVFGSYANKVKSSLTYQVRKLNFDLMNLACEIPNLYICDVAGLQNKYGRNYMYDPAVYTSTEMVFSLDSIPLIASRVMNVIEAIEGKAKKCLIVDLDNTLWGGVIGDDGLEGIELGHGLGIGKVFTELQEWIKKLRNRGIIICVCSKNDEEKAKEPFQKHPDMILRLDDISVFIANWKTKVENINMIQKILNIGFDSMVFLDDNAFERNIVRENIKGITVPELPEDPAEYLEYLYSLNLFETASYSSLDLDRTKQYQEQAERVEFENTFTSEGDFLKSLGMVSKVEGFTRFNIARVAQLSQRSNQFNLRTVRYTEADIKRLSDDPNVIPLSFTLDDRFGRNGLIAVVVMKKQEEDTLFVDTWLMSCRVLNRGMENFTLNTMVDEAKRVGAKKIVGEYIRTKKNDMVSEHYLKMGFKKIVDSVEDKFVLDITKYEYLPCFIEEKVDE